MNFRNSDEAAIERIRYSLVWFSNKHFFPLVLAKQTAWSTGVLGLKRGEMMELVRHLFTLREPHHLSEQRKHFRHTQEKVCYFMALTANSTGVY